MSILAIGFLTFALVWAAGFGARAAWTAGGNARGRGRWFLFGAVLGPVALAILDVAPPGICASCLTPVIGWSMTCPICRDDVRSNPRLIELNRFVEPDAPVPAPTVGAPAATNGGRGRDRRSGAGAAAPRSTAQARRRAPTPAAAAPTLAAAASKPAVPALEPTRAAAKAPQRQSTDVPAPEPSASVATERSTAFAGVPVFDAPATGPRDDGMAVATPGLDLDPRRPIRLASGIFVDGAEHLIPGYWYELSSEGGILSISGPPGSLPSSGVVARPLSDIRLKQRGDQLEITVASGSGTYLWLAFRSTLDWTPLGLANEVEVRRRAWGVGGAAIH